MSKQMKVNLPTTAVELNFGITVLKAVAYHFMNLGVFHNITITLRKQRGTFIFAHIS